MNRAAGPPLVYVEADMAEGELHAFAGGHALVFTARAPAKDSPNEDAAALIPFDEESGVLVVADGIGGGRAGEQASRTTIGAIESALAEARANSALLRTGIIDGIERANRAVLDLGLGAGTTLALVEIQGSAVRPYHVGDSVILATGQRGKVKWQSICHSPIGYAVEAGVMAEADAMHHADRHLVSNLVGSPSMRIELGPALELAPRDTLLIASDGLADNLHTDEIIERVRKGPLARVGTLLASAVRDRMVHPADGAPSKPDDLTFVIYRPSTRPRSRSEPAGAES